MKTIVITGATSGIGLEAARLLAGEGYRVIGIGRSEERCRQAGESILSSHKQADIRFFTADLMQQREVLRVAGEIRSDLKEHGGGGLHALINNAGCVRSWYMTTDEGYEQQFALNYLSAFLLTHALFPSLKQAKGRVIFTGSGSHKHTKVRWNDLMFTKRYRPLIAYKQSKLLIMLLAEAINELQSTQDVCAYVVDPGLVNTDIGNKGTGGVVDLVWKLRKGRGVPPAVPAKTYVFLCDSKSTPQGLYYDQTKQKRFSKQVTRENAARLLTVSEQLCDVQFGKENTK